MKPAPLVLTSLCTLALAACAPGDEGDKERGSAPPLGFELAVAQTTGGEEAPGEQIIELTPEQLRAKLSGGNVRLIDVRRPDEFAEGAIEGAELIPLDDFDPAALDMSDGREIVLYCRSGRRSGIAARALAQHTGEPAQHLAGGFIAWSEGSAHTPAD